MGRETVLFSSEDKTNRQAVADFLRQLADKIQDGQVILKQGGNEAVAVIPNNLVLELKLEEELKKKRMKRSLEVEIEWYDGDDAEAGGVTLG